MREFARLLGYIDLAAGVMLLGLPSVTRSLIKARGEFAQLPDSALRFLGGWMFLLGGTLIWMAERPEIEAKIREGVTAGWRRAA